MYTSFVNKIGHLDLDLPKRSGGKKIFTWSFYAAGAKTPEHIEIYCLNDHNKHEVYFSAHCSKFLNGSIQHTDIHELKKQVEQVMMDQSSILSGIVWEDWLEISVSGSDVRLGDRVNSATGASLEIKVDRLKRGIHPETGNPVTLNCNGIVVDFPTATAITEKSPDGRILGCRSAAERSYLPATPENIHALTLLMENMAIIRTKLAALLSQSMVHGVLANIKENFPLLSEK